MGIELRRAGEIRQKFSVDLYREGHFLYGCRAAQKHILECPDHSQQARPMNVDGIDFPGPNPADPPCQALRFDYRSQGFPSLLADFFRIRQSGNQFIFPEQYRGRDDGARKGAPSHFIQPADHLFHFRLMVFSDSQSPWMLQ
jgi:hypothetical protein